MAQNETKLTGPGHTKGAEPNERGEGGKLVGHAGGEQVLLIVVERSFLL
jgi:hypothetical protein